MRPLIQQEVLMRKGSVHSHNSAFEVELRPQAASIYPHKISLDEMILQGDRQRLIRMLSYQVQVQLHGFADSNLVMAEVLAWVGNS